MHQATNAGAAQRVGMEGSYRKRFARDEISQYVVYYAQSEIGEA